FEHIDNAPMMPYYYVNASGQTMPWVDPAPRTSWLFSSSNCVAPFNEPRIHARNLGKIEAVVPSDGIGPGNTCRINAWGTPPDRPAHAANNTNIINVNNGTVRLLADTDARKNYLMIGATWNSFGSSLLANTTLETFDQPNANQGGKGCSTCHLG